MITEISDHERDTASNTFTSEKLIGGLYMRSVECRKTDGTLVNELNLKSNYMY